MSEIKFSKKKLYEVSGIDNRVFDFLVINLDVKNCFLLLKSPTLEHILAKRISCELYAPYAGERGTS